MSISQNLSSNSSFASIRYGPSASVQPDTDKHEKHPTLAIDLEVLKAIRRTVLAIKKRIDAGGGSNLQPYINGNSNNSKTFGPNCGQDLNSEEA